MARLLVVDDDVDILALVQLRLRGAGHHVVTALSGEDALALVAAHGLPDVAVLDVSMPGMSGFQLLWQLRGRQDGDILPVIFLSARVLPKDIETGCKLGATYLTKPFAAHELLTAVDSALASRVAPDGR